MILLFDNKYVLNLSCCFGHSIYISKLTSLRQHLKWAVMPMAGRRGSQLSRNVIGCTVLTPSYQLPIVAHLNDSQTLVLDPELPETMGRSPEKGNNASMRIVVVGGVK